MLGVAVGGEVGAGEGTADAVMVGCELKTALGVLLCNMVGPAESTCDGSCECSTLGASLFNRVGMALGTGVVERKVGADEGLVVGVSLDINDGF